MTARQKNAFPRCRSKRPLVEIILTSCKQRECAARDIATTSVAPAVSASDIFYDQCVASTLLNVHPLAGIRSVDWSSIRAKPPDESLVFHPTGHTSRYTVTARERRMDEYTSDRNLHGRFCERDVLSDNKLLDTKYVPH